MDAWLYHWVWLDLYVPVWPNLVASALCSVLVYIRLRIHQVRQHEELKRHVTAMVAAPDKEIEAK